MRLNFDNYLQISISDVSVNVPNHILAISLQQKYTKRYYNND